MSLPANIAADRNEAAHGLIRVAVVEDNATLRRNLDRWLARTPGFECVAACESGETALETIPREVPDVVLMDIHMPGMSGVECTARLKPVLPAVQILMLTVYEDTETIFKALRAGASGYLLKRATPQEVLSAIRDVRQGGAPMTSAIARKIVSAFQEPMPQADPSIALSEREREVLDGLARGHSNKEIGALLQLSPLTVKNHLANIYQKLHVRCRTEAVMAYLHHKREAGAAPGPPGLQP